MLTVKSNAKRRLKVLVFVAFCPWVFADTDATADSISSVSEASTEQAQAYVRGEAFAPGSDTLLYVEEHFRISESQHKVVYQDAAGKLIADKKIDYSSNAIAPNVRVEDFRAQRLTTIEHGDEICTVVIAGLNDSSDQETSTFKAIKHDVMDAGFDNYVRQQWQSLNQAKTVKFRFMLPLRGSSIGLKLAPRECTTEDSALTDKPLCLRISPSNWLVSALAGPIDLVYEMNSQRLLRFVGQGQLPDAKGRSLEVDLRYTYP